MAIEVGSQAPDFTLRDEDGNELSLSDLRGRNVVLIFFPFAFSRGCTKELHDVTGLKERFAAVDAEVLGVSVDSPFVLKAFKEAEGLSAHLLSDFEPKGEVARKYGAYLEHIGTATRASFVIDKNGRIAYATATDLGVLRDQDEVVEALASCPV